MHDYLEIQILNNDHNLFTIGLNKRIGSELFLQNYIDKEGSLKLMEFVIEYIIKENVVLKNGETIAYGLWQLKFFLQEGYLHIYENTEDFTGWCSGVVNAVFHLEQQREICIQNNTISEIPSFNQGIAISPGVLEGDYVQGIRYPAPKHMSGWYITSYKYNGNINELKVLKVFELIRERKDILRYLALPVGFVFEIGSETSKVWFEKEEF
jgi:hypothetical protein